MTQCRGVILLSPERSIVWTLIYLSRLHWEQLIAVPVVDHATSSKKPWPYVFPQRVGVKTRAGARLPFPAVAGLSASRREGKHDYSNKDPLIGWKTSLLKHLQPVLKPTNCLSTNKKNPLSGLLWGRFHYKVSRSVLWSILLDEKKNWYQEMDSAHYREIINQYACWILHYVKFTLNVCQLLNISCQLYCSYAERNTTLNGTTTVPLKG